MFCFCIFALLFINRILLNENYQHIFNTGYFYSLVCTNYERASFNKTFNNTNLFNGKLLDYGCGPGIMSIFFNDDKYIGIDIDKTRISYATQKYPNKHFIQVNNTLTLPFDDAVFDIILFNDCIHHISNYNMITILPEIFRVLKTEGIVIIREPIKDTNFFTYFITELLENGNYLRTRNEYKSLFNYPFTYNHYNIVNETSHFEWFRHYYILIIKKNTTHPINLHIVDKSKDYKQITSIRAIFIVLTYLFLFFYSIVLFLYIFD
jgi:ubiquinone/menaquinone biosynthesis C-methylase UbiE